MNNLWLEWLIDKFITDDPNGINWIKIGDTNSSMYITQTAQKIIPEGMKKSRYVQPGDFLLSNSMSFGRPYILKIDVVDAGVFLCHLVAELLCVGACEGVVVERNYDFGVGEKRVIRECVTDV